MSEKIKLGEIIDTIQGSQYPLDEQITEYKEGYLRFLRISDYTKSDEPIRYVKYSGKELVCEENEVVVVRYGNVGFIGYGKKGILANNLFVLRLKNEKFDSKYLYYYLNSPNINNAIVNKANSSTMPALTHKMIKDLEIPIVDIEKQKCIVNELDKIQKIIDIREEQIEYFDELIKSQFVEMFENEKYPKKTLSELTDKITDGSHNPPTGIAENQGYMMLSSQNIINNSINYDNVRYLKKEDFEKENRRTDLQKGDVLLTIVGTVGRTAIMTEESNIVLQRSVAVIKPNKEINSAYLVGALNSESVINQLNKGAKGVAQKGIYLNDLKKIIIKVPPIELQNQFADIVKQIDKQKFEIENSLKEMQELYESLMEKYFG